MTRLLRPDSSGQGSGWSSLSSHGPASWGVVVVVALGWLAVVLAASAVFECLAMSPVACSAGSTAAVAALVVAAVGARAGWLGAVTARRVQALPQIPIPPALARAAHRSDTIPVRCVGADVRVAFCAGLWRPQIYVSLGTVAGLADDELAAVLAHENAHARRRDPLRGLLVRACADVAFFAPLLRWWQHRRHLNAELAADRAAVEHAGAPALAGALLRLADDSSPGVAAEVPAFGPTASLLDARITALTSTAAPRQPLSAHAGAATIVGALAAGVIVTCLPALVSMLG